MKTIQEVAGELYEAARRYVLRHDAIMWPLATSEVRKKWVAFAAALPLNGLAIDRNGPPPNPAADELYEAAMDQPHPTAALKRAISRYAASRR